GGAADQSLLGLELRDALLVQPVDQALHLPHHFGADAVAGEKQQFIGRHGSFLIQPVMAGLVPAIHVLLSPTRTTWMPGTRPGMTTNVAARGSAKAPGAD